MRSPEFGPALPIDAVLPALLSTLADHNAAVLQAPPGAGKTTRVPLALIDQPWVADRRILVLEPRRLATRAAADHMARLLGEPVGRQVGYRMRLDSRVGPKTRVEVLTEGLFLRRLQGDPGLDGVAAVLFDEIHERNLDTDLALTLAREAQGALRPDLRLLAMSATIDAQMLAERLGGWPTIHSEGRQHPVETRFVGAPDTARDGLERAIAKAVGGALGEIDGDILVFLPGGREIRRVQRFLDGRFAGTVSLHPLYGDLGRDHQRAALAPAPAGQRKIVLASPIAETSLTIDGVRIVVDSGLRRAPRFDPRTGMGRLETIRISRASADQRCGRAGRQGPGLCIRLWDPASHRARPPQETPEILESDLTALALELSVWGARADQLVWLDPPPAGALAQARDLLHQLGALDATGQLTGMGQRMADLGVHPRLAHMALAGTLDREGATAAALAALLSERDMLLPGTRDPDLTRRVAALGGARDERADPEAVRRLRVSAKDLRRRMGIAEGRLSADRTGRLLALAYPDRIAQAVGNGHFRLANGSGALLEVGDPIAGTPLLSVAHLGGDRNRSRILLAAPLAEADFEALFGNRVQELDHVGWDHRDKAVRATRRRCFGKLILTERPHPDPPDGDVVTAMLEGVRRLGIAALPWTKAIRDLQARALFLRKLDGPDSAIVDLGDAALLDRLDGWLAPFLNGIRRADQLNRVDLATALESQLDWQQQQRLRSEAPTHVQVPSGARHRLDYAADHGPALDVRLQEVFGWETTPTVAGGRVPVLLRLLSPARRPLQVTRDLAGFWRTGYPQVRGEMRGRYPKHFWPEDPLTAKPYKK